VKANTKVTPKMTIPSPAVLHFRGGRKGISTSVYPDLDAFFDDLAKTYKDAVRGVLSSGLPLSAARRHRVGLSVLAEGTRARQAARRRSDAAAGDLRPRDQRGDQGPPLRHDDHHACVPRQLPLHLDFGRRLRAGRRVLFGKVGYDGYFLEYDTERAGGFEPLRFVPKGKKQIVLGLVTSKSGTLEKKDDIKKRIDEATKYVALDQLCLSPQCGFASTEEGNVLAEDEQWAKLKMIVDLSREVWG
jgi:5-methyltetrahydropteroyltriglutamate--homocysteine methyltransferase